MPLVILDIIRLSLEITLEVIKGIPIEDRQQLWKDHQARLEFWQRLFERLQPKEPT